MRKDNTQNYQTPNSRRHHFRDLVNDPMAELEDMDKLSRSYTDNEDQTYDLPNLTKYNFNKTTRKMDDLSREEVKDKKKALVDGGVVKPAHKYKILKSFEAWSSSFVDDQSIPQLNRNLEVPKSVGVVISAKDMTGCGCCDSCNGQEDCRCCGDCTCAAAYDENLKIRSYMFFHNLEQIHQQSKQLLGLDRNKVDQILSDGHNWAEDHISVAKENLSHVYSFLNTKLNENHKSGRNYMFFGNLETISKLTSSILKLDKAKVDNLLNSGHDWAEDHIASAKENVQQVWEFLMNE